MHQEAPGTTRSIRASSNVKVFRSHPDGLLAGDNLATPSGDSLKPPTPIRIATLGGVLAICVLIGGHVWIKLTHLPVTGVTALYTAAISTYVLSRFALAAFYRSPRDVGLEPTVAIVVPAYNEGPSIARTMLSCLTLDYPADKLEIVLVNDGSTDDTWEHMLSALSESAEIGAAAREATAAPPRKASVVQVGRVRCINFATNRGKRAAMAAGIRGTTAEILLFIDSDSAPAEGSLRKLVRGFADSKVGAISGLTHARNARTNLLTAMQATRYYVSFQLLKSAESVLGAVVCCSGCFAAYRRSAVEPLLESWENQRFLGVACTYGDDRALTNSLLRSGWITRFDCEAEAWTDVPERYGKFFRQQLRWKKSWAREGPILLTHIWRTRPRAFPSVLIATLAGMLSPLVLLYNALEPLRHPGTSPLIYLIGLYFVSVAYALLYRGLRSDGLWPYVILGTWFYVAFSAQLLWAIVRLKDGAWGTRGLVGSGLRKVPENA